jgi:hypothetical protein
MNYAELLAAIGQETRLDLGAAVQSGSCAIRFDDRLDVVIDSEKDGTAAQLHVELGVVDEDALEHVLPALLQIHLFGIATDDAYFGFSSSRHAVMLFRALPLDTLHSREAIEALASFVNQSIRWADALPQLSKEGTLQAPPPPFMMPA